MNDQLKLTLSSGVVHGFKCRVKESGKIYTIRGFINQDDKVIICEGEECLSKVSFSNIELLMHPISRLTEPILTDGKIPIVELLRIYNEKYLNNKLNESDDDIYIDVFQTYISAYVKLRSTIELKLWLNEVHNWPTWITDQLDAWHINYRGVEAVEIVND